MFDKYDGWPKTLKGQSLKSEASDIDLVNSFIKGSNTAFEELVKRYKTKIFGFIYVQIHQRAQDAEDLTQDVFVQLYQKATTYRQESAFSSFLYAIARNIVLNYFRQNTRRVKLYCVDALSKDEEDTFGNFESKTKNANASPEDLLTINQKYDLTIVALNALSNEERQLLVLHDRENFSYEQISSILNINIGTVRSRLHNSRKKLLAIINEGKHEM